MTLLSDSARPYTIEFYEDPSTGRAPVHEWITEQLSRYHRRALGTLMSEILEKHGVNVCETEYGRHLGGGLFEFRLRHDSDEIIGKHTNRTPDDEPDQGPILLRVFCHAYGDKVDDRRVHAVRHECRAGVIEMDELLAARGLASQTRNVECHAGQILTMDAPAVYVQRESRRRRDPDLRRSFE